MKCKERFDIVTHQTPSLKILITWNQEPKEIGDKNSAISLLFTFLPPYKKVLDISMLDSTKEAKIMQFYVTYFTVHKYIISFKTGSF